MYSLMPEPSSSPATSLKSNLKNNATSPTECAKTFASRHKRKCNSYRPSVVAANVNSENKKNN